MTLSWDHSLCFSAARLVRMIQRYRGWVCYRSGFYLPAAPLTNTRGWLEPPTGHPGGPWRGLEIASSGQDLGLVVSMARPPDGRWLFNVEIYPALWIGQRINRIIEGPLPIDQMANLAQPVDLQ